jgi:3' terminal RNA ribose 2'-O-methyltransferase Hen1
MLLTITNHQAPATDLGFLVHKHPERVQSLDVSFGRAHVFYPEVSRERCTVALLLDVDPVGLVRNRRGPAGEGQSLAQYVNDRPYASSSFLSVAMTRTFREAMAGKSKERPDLAEAKLPLTARLSALPCKGDADFLQRLFEPLGYQVRATGYALDPKFPGWGSSYYFSVELQAETRLQDLLTHIYVLAPVLDAEKHYWVGNDELEKLLRHGEGWLARHPEKGIIVNRYLRHKKNLTRAALERLVEEESPDPDSEEADHAREELEIEEPLKLWQRRMASVVAVLKERQAVRILDLGCGEGRLMRELLEEKSFRQITGMDVSSRSLEIAARRLRLEDMTPAKKERVHLMHGSLMYKDARLAGFDAACVVEVIEHLDPPRLAAFERVLFEFARPGTVVITTPNADYNQKFPTLPAGKFRHKDHRFEWSRQEFETWANSVAGRYGYAVRFQPVGDEDEQLGAATQMGVFTR